MHNKIFAQTSLILATFIKPEYTVRFTRRPICTEMLRYRAMHGMFSKVTRLGFYCLVCFILRFTLGGSYCDVEDQKLMLTQGERRVRNTCVYSQLQKLYSHKRNTNTICERVKQPHKHSLSSQYHKYLTPLQATKKAKRAQI